MNTASSVHADIRHIILVDDEEDCHFVTRLVLKKAGYTGRITWFTRPEEALSAMRQEEQGPELMFVDINMPGMNGFEFLEHCEQEGVLPNGHTAVVMFSSSNRAQDLDRARRFRSVIDYVEKALTVDAFQHIVETRDRILRS